MYVTSYQISTSNHYFRPKIIINVSLLLRAFDNFSTKFCTFLDQQFYSQRNALSCPITFGTTRYICVVTQSCLYSKLLTLSLLSITCRFTFYVFHETKLLQKRQYISISFVSRFACHNHKTRCIPPFLFFALSFSRIIHPVNLGTCPTIVVLFIAGGFFNFNNKATGYRELLDIEAMEQIGASLLQQQPFNGNGYLCRLQFILTIRYDGNVLIINIAFQ